jgi:hypothetical protein
MNKGTLLIFPKARRSTRLFAAMYHAGNSIGPEDGGHIHKGSWYVEVIGNCPYLVQRSQAYVQAYAEKVVFWHKKTG